MTFDSPFWAPNADAERERESRVTLALLRGVLENLRGMRLVIPLLALAVCAIFSQWVRLPLLAAWYGQVVLGMVPQVIVLWCIPRGELTVAQAAHWTRLAAATNLFFVACWASLGWYLWVPGNPFNHIVIQLILAATLASHATTTAACRTIARPALLLYLVVMVGVPLQGHDTPTVYLVLVSPFFIGFVGLIGQHSYTRARAAILAGEERNSLLAELVMAKLESDRGRDRAEAASVAKSQFLANMSHELRTPLNAILGFSELISSRMFDGDPNRNYEYAGMIHTSGQHLLALINDILDLAKIEAGRWKLEEGEVDLHRVVGDALQLVTWRAKDNGATLVNGIDPDIDMIYADERAVKQVLLNLLSNAVKFTPEHGRITAFARRGADGGLMFGVSDNGVGISPADQRQVFDSFGQGKHDVTLADKGTGLGLAIVKGLAESHGGDVTLESEVGRGTTVTVYLPASRVRPRRKRQSNDDLAHFVA